VILDGDEPAAIEYAQKRGLPRTFTTITLRGVQWHFAHPGKDIYLVSDSKIIPEEPELKLDFKGEKQYCVAPGSVRENNFVYAPAPGFTMADVASLAPLPDWLLENRRRKPVASLPAGVPRIYQGHKSPRAGKALEDEIATLQSTTEGRRNNQLFRSTANLYELVAAGELDDNETEDAILDAVEHWPADTGVRATFESGRNKGLANPRAQTPPRQQTNHASFHVNGATKTTEKAESEEHTDRSTHGNANTAGNNKAEKPATDKLKAEPKKPRLTGNYGADLAPGREHLLAIDEKGGRAALCNYAATITALILFDDGAGGEQRAFEITVHHRGQRYVIEVPAADFDGMKWPSLKLPPSASATTPSLAKSIPLAIKHLSAEASTQRVYSHTGWRKIDCDWVWLNADACIGPKGRVENIRVEMPEAKLDKIRLSDPLKGQELTDAVKRHLQMLDLVPHNIVIPSIGAVLAAFIEETDFSVHMHSETDAYKSSYALVLQRHVGPDFQIKDLQNWHNTANALQTVAFVAKDCPLVIDEYSPSQVGDDEKTARRFFQAKGNCAGRARLNRAAELQQGKEPRSLPLSTGEELPSGVSGIARVLCIRFEKGPHGIKPDNLKKIQDASADGYYANAMAGFIQWLAPQRDTIRKFRPPHQVPKQGEHSRTAAIIRDLKYAWTVYLLFAAQVGALDSETNLLEVVTTQLDALVAGQRDNQQMERPEQILINALRSLLASNKVYLHGRGNDAPENPLDRGWRATTGRDGQPYYEPVPGATKLGWLVDNELYLIPEMAFKQAADFVPNRNLGVSKYSEMTQRLATAGWLLTDSDGKNLCVRRPGGNQLPRCWKLDWQKFFRDDPD
jgi:hypothetical protein